MGFIRENVFFNYLKIYLFNFVFREKEFCYLIILILFILIGIEEKNFRNKKILFIFYYIIFGSDNEIFYF